MKKNYLSLNTKDIITFAKTHVAIVLWVFLLLMLLAEIFVLKNSVIKFLASNDESLFGGAQIVRVDFPAYQQIEERLVNNEQFMPAETKGSDPFGVKP